MASRLFGENHPTTTPKPDNANILRRIQGGQGRDTDTRRGPRRANPPRADRDLGAGRGRKRGEQTGTGKAADAGTWRGSQGRAAEAGGRQVRVMSRWVAFRAGGGGGERVKVGRDSNRNSYVWVEVRK